MCVTVMKIFFEVHLYFASVGGIISGLYDQPDFTTGLDNGISRLPRTEVHYAGEANVITNFNGDISVLVSSIWRFGDTLGAVIILALRSFAWCWVGFSPWVHDWL